jgi:aryl-alcohol dehydrogenase-like predicted oxidoreductase
MAAPIASATSVTQVTELIGALDVTLSAEDMAALDKAIARRVKQAVEIRRLVKHMPNYHEPNS